MVDEFCKWADPQSAVVLEWGIQLRNDLDMLFPP